MTKEQLFESMQYLDDDILERSEKRARPMWSRWAVAAACVCAVAAAVIGTAPQLRAPEMPVPMPDVIGELPEKGTPPAYTDELAATNDWDGPAPEPLPAEPTPAASGPSIDATDDVPVAFSALPLPAGQIDPALSEQFGAAAVDVAAFDEETLSQCCGIVEGTVTRMYVKNYAYDTRDDKFGEMTLFHHVYKTVVYELEISRVWYGDAFAENTTILIEDGLYFSSENLALMAGRSYVLPVYEAGEAIGSFRNYVSGDITRDSVYGNVYPYHPQITVTEDGDYIVTSDWETLSADPCRVILAEGAGWYAELRLVGADDFAARLGKLIQTYLR